MSRTCRFADAPPSPSINRAARAARGGASAILSGGSSKSNRSRAWRQVAGPGLTAYLPPGGLRPEDALSCSARFGAASRSDDRKARLFRDAAAASFGEGVRARLPAIDALTILVGFGRGFRPGDRIAKIRR